MATPNDKKPKLMVENISCILPQSQQKGGLYLGNTYGAQNSDILKEYGIRAVLTTSIETPISYNPLAIPFHLKIEAHDKQDYYIHQHLQQCIDFIHRHRQYTNVYVHCYAGVSRSATIVIAYLMQLYQWDLDTSLNFVKFKRVVAKPNEGFMQQLKQFQQKIGKNGFTRQETGSTNSNQNIRSYSQSANGTKKSIKSVQKHKITPSLKSNPPKQTNMPPAYQTDTNTNKRVISSKSNISYLDNKYVTNGPISPNYNTRSTNSMTNTPKMNTSRNFEWKKADEEEEISRYRNNNYYYTNGPNSNNSYCQNSRSNLSFKNQVYNNEVHGQVQEEPLGFNKNTTNIRTKHSEIPIPKILGKIGTSNKDTGRLDKETATSNKESGTKQTLIQLNSRNNPIKQTQKAVGNGQNSMKNLIRPKDLPGYRRPPQQQQPPKIHNNY